MKKQTVEIIEAYHCSNYTKNFIQHPSSKITPNAENVFASSS